MATLTKLEQMVLAYLDVQKRGFGPKPFMVGEGLKAALKVLRNDMPAETQAAIDAVLAEKSAVTFTHYGLAPIEPPICLEPGYTILSNTPSEVTCPRCLELMKGKGNG